MPASVADQIRSQMRVHLDLPGPDERRRLRLASGLSQQKLADIIGVSRQTICQYESGARMTPRGSLLARYVEALRAMREAL